MEQNLKKENEMAKYEEKGWAIKNDDFGFYVGWYFTRREMIARHVEGKAGDWRRCRKNGDRCVKVLIKEVS